MRIHVQVKIIVSSQMSGEYRSRRWGLGLGSRSLSSTHSRRGQQGTVENPADEYKQSQDPHHRVGNAAIANASLLLYLHLTTVSSQIEKRGRREDGRRGSDRRELALRLISRLLRGGIEKDGDEARGLIVGDSVAVEIAMEEIAEWLRRGDEADVSNARAAVSGAAAFDAVRE